MLARFLLGKARPGRSITLLVSFCNVRDFVRPVLATVTIEKGKETEVRWIQGGGIPPLRGATGLCYWRDLVCVAHQRALKSPPGFVILDPNRDFRVVSRGKLPAGPHSVCARGDDLYIVVTGRDSVYRATPMGEGWEVERHWTFPGSSGEDDQNHINSVAIIDGRLCVSGFGAKTFDQWNSAKDGFVYDVDNCEFVWKGIHHPHSLFVEARDAQRNVWICESAKNNLLSRAGPRIKVPSTYLRGLARANENFYVGSSRRRLVSESTGARTSSHAKGDYAGSCSISRILGGGASELVIDFTGQRDEIYDILALRV